MLTKVHKILLGLLAAQILLTIFILVRGDDSSPAVEQPLLPGFDAAKVTRIKVHASGSDQPGVDLAKRGSNWVVASAFDYPADTTKVDALLTPVAKMAAAAPIATSTARHKQLKVGDKDFERKIVLTADGKDTTLVIGAPAGLRRNAIRLGGSDDVYAVSGVSSYLAGGDAKQWVKDRYLEIPRDDIAKVEIKRGDTTIVLEKEAPPAPAAGSGSGSAAPPVPPPTTPPAWKATIGGAPVALAAGETLDTDAIDRIAGEVASIGLDAPADPKRDASNPTAVITITRKASGATTATPVVIDVVVDGDKYWVHDKSQPQAVLVAKSQLENAVTLEKDKLVKKPEPKPDPGAGSGSAAAPTPPAPPAPGKAATPPAKAPGPAKAPVPTTPPATKTPAPAKAPAPATAPPPAPKK